MSTHVPEFWSFSDFSHHFVLAKLATRSISVNDHQVKKNLLWSLSLTVINPLGLTIDSHLATPC